MFKEYVSQATKLMSQLSSDLNTRDSLKQGNKATGLLDAEINGTFKSLDEKLDELDQEIKSYKGQLLAKEVQKRQNIYLGLSNQRVELRKRMEQFHQKFLQENLFNQNAAQPQYQSFGKLNVNVLQMHSEVTNRQDDNLQRLNEKASNIKYISLNIHKNIQEQNGLITSLKSETIGSLDQMQRLKGKMVMFVQDQSNCMLMTIIVLELIFLFLIIIF